MVCFFIAVRERFGTHPDDSYPQHSTQGKQVAEQLFSTAPARTGPVPDLNKPSPTTPFASVFYQSPTNEGAASALAKSVCNGHGLTVVTGESGMGKTSFVDNVIGHLGSQIRPVFLWYAHISVKVMLSYVCEQLGFAGAQPPGSRDEEPGNDALRHHLLTLLQDGPSMVLVIDDAHTAPVDVLTEALWLTRSQSGQHHIQTILVGLPQLEERLCSSPLAELIDELPRPIRINPFGQDEVREFIRLQLRAIGGEREDRFTAEAIAKINSYSRGTPRLIKALFDATLVTADLDALETITEDTVEDAVRLFSPPWAKETMQLPDAAEANSNAVPGRAADNAAANLEPSVVNGITGERDRVEKLFSKLLAGGTTQSVQGRHDTRGIHDDEYGRSRDSTDGANPLTLHDDTFEKETIANIVHESEKPMSRVEDLNKVLKRLQAGSPDVEATALISEDGLMIAGALPQDLEETRIAGMSATLLSLGTRAATELRRGEIEEVIVRGEHGYAVMLNAGRGVLLLAVANENAKLGLIFFDMREAIGAIKRIL